MDSSTIYLAIDLGASSGRVLAGSLQSGQCCLEEVHRFPNDPISIGKRMHWDLLGLWHHIQHGIDLAAKKYGDRIASIGCDTWGVDYVLLDRNEDLLGPAFCYRDPRTSGLLPKAFTRLPREQIFAESGLQFMEINTAYQLLSMRLENSPILDIAAHFLMVPDFFHWLLSGRRCNEYTNASTTQLMRPTDQTWSKKILAAFEIPERLFLTPVQPGTVLGPLLDRLARRTHLTKTQVVVPATHDTGSAVLAVPAGQFAAEKPDWCYISSGTWSLMGLELAKPNLGNACQRLNFTNEGGALGSVRLLKNISGLWPLQQCRAQWLRQGLDIDWDDLVQQAQTAEPFQAIFDPDDARFTAAPEMLDAVESFLAEHGQSMPASPGGVCRAALECLALRYRICLGWLEEIVGYPIRTIHIVGGGSQNELLCQMTADACNRQVVAGPVEATAIGNVLMQAIGLGHLTSILKAREFLAKSPELKHYQPREPKAWDEPARKFEALLA
jgi:rhamnulokinase